MKDSWLMRCLICLWFRVGYELFVVLRVSMLEAVHHVGLKVVGIRLHIVLGGMI